MEMEHLSGPQSPSGSACEAVQSRGRGPSGEFAVPLSKRSICAHILLLYGGISGVVLSLIFLAGDIGMVVAFAFLALTLPYVLWGATLLYEQRPVVVVNALTGVSIRHSALVGEKFAPCGPVFGLPWEAIERWEVWHLRLGVPLCGSLLKVYLRDAEAFVRSQGFVCGQMRFLGTSFCYGTPVVLSDLMLQQGAEAIAGFMNAARPMRQNVEVDSADGGAPDQESGMAGPRVVVRQ